MSVSVNVLVIVSVYASQYDCKYECKTKYISANVTVYVIVSIIKLQSGVVPLESPLGYFAKFHLGVCYIWCITAPKVLPKFPYELSITKCQELPVPRVE